jgi:hypothetical protein
MDYENSSQKYLSGFSGVFGRYAALNLPKLPMEMGFNIRLAYLPDP